MMNFGACIELCLDFKELKMEYLKGKASIETSKNDPIVNMKHLKFSLSVVEISYEMFISVYELFKQKI